MELCLRLRELRDENELTQEKVAAFLNIKQNTYSQYENGRRQVPTEVLIKLSRLYKVSVDYILGLTD